MRIRFNGGPWDGVEFESPVCPDAIGFRHLDVRFEATKKPLVWRMHSARRDHHQYLFDRPKIEEGVQLIVGENLEREPQEGEPLMELVDPKLLVFHYRYAPGEKPEFE